MARSSCLLADGEVVLKKRGRKRALTDEQVEHARHLYNTTSCSMDRVARHFHVSQGVIQQVIDRKGAYK